MCSLTGRTAKNARGILCVSQLVRRYNLLVTRTCMCLLRISKHWMIRLRSLRLHLLSVYTAFAVQPQTCSVSSFEHAGEVFADTTLQREAQWCDTEKSGRVEVSNSNRSTFYQQPSTFTGEGDTRDLAGTYTHYNYAYVSRC